MISPLIPHVGCALSNTFCFCDTSSPSSKAAIKLFASGLLFLKSLNATSYSFIVLGILLMSTAFNQSLRQTPGIGCKSPKLILGMQ